MVNRSAVKIDVRFDPFELDEVELRGKNIVVIDVLRSSTTIAVALNNGAREIIPVESIENAVKISRVYSASAENQITQQWDKKRKA